MSLGPGYSRILLLPTRTISPMQRLCLHESYEEGRGGLKRARAAGECARIQRGGASVPWLLPGMAMEHVEQK